MLNQLILTNNKMKICITTVYDKLALIAYVNRQEQCGLVAAKGKVLDIIYNNKPLTIDASPFDTHKLNEICTFNIINPMKQNQFEFKPFDEVLVKGNYRDSKWINTHFGYILHKNNEISYVCSHGLSYANCIPYNEETAHLLGTTKDYKKSEPKEYHVWTSGTFNEWMTESEFKNFIETAVIHNKDITDFHVLRIRQ